MTTDAYGDIYVVSIIGSESRIDIFNPEGHFISEVEDPAGAQSIAIDADGNMYLFERLPGGERQVRRFPPTVYKPEEKEIEYSEEPVVVTNESTKELLFTLGPESSLDVDRTTGKVYFNNGSEIYLFGSAAEENKLLSASPIIDLERSTSTAIDSAHKKIYVSDKVPVTHKTAIRIFELESPYKEVGKITGSTTPKGEFLTGEGFLAVDVDEDVGHVFVGDLEAASKVYEFAEDGTYLATIEHSFTAVPFEEIAVDDGKFSPHPQTEGWLFVPSEPAPALGHVYAFEPNEEGPPVIESASVGDVTETEATLRATINPGGLETIYRLEYVSEEQFKEEGGESFENENAMIAGEGTLTKGGEGIAISAPATELEPGTKYRLRVFAENTKGKDAEEKTFKTFPVEEELPSCENEAFRIALSALLPDCRAYELVTPPSTNGKPPTGGFAGVYFPTLRAAPDGNRASFLIEGGTLPGSESAGAFNGDPYVATRGSEGWTSESAGPDRETANTKPSPGGFSPDQSYSFWEATTGPTYIRYPDGHSEFVGRGSLGEDPAVQAELITENAGHIVFATEASRAVQLEPNAPPAGTGAVYDRSAEGPTHVVSLLPGDETPKAGENAGYLGASEDGEGIAFSIGKTIYLRLGNSQTFEVAGPTAAFAGVTDEGKRVFYVEGGDLFAFDAGEEKTIPFSASGDVTPVNVASGGTRAYFVSPSVLTGEEENPNGEKAKEGAQNLYLSEEGQISFVAQVTKRDVEGEKRSDGLVGGLGLWVEAVQRGTPAKDPSRTTPAGTTLLFESRADLTGFESQGFAQVFRYDATEGRLNCLSCSQTETPPTSDASLQSISREQFSREIGGSFLKISNQSPDGQRAFFQTAEPLVLGDSDGQLDVYEWEEEEVGSCKQEGGCLYLISGGQSASPDYLFAMSASGDDVFFRTADLLVPRDEETTLSIYDARVGGGFPEEEVTCQGEECCQGECRPLSTAPQLPAPTTAVPGPDENLHSPLKCPKGKHKAERHGRKVCVKKHHRHRRQRSHSGQKGGTK